jgi:DNA polymerase III delta prime subunit
MLDFQPKQMGDLMVPSSAARRFIEAFIKCGQKIEHQEMKVPFLIFVGPTGYGKSAAANVILREACNITQGADMMVINAGTQGGRDMLDRALHFTETYSLSSSRKAVLLDEADRFSGVAKADLKGVMDKLSERGVPAILTTNNLGGIDPAVQSRSEIINWTAPSAEQLVSRAKQVLNASNLTASDELLDKLVNQSGRDARRFCRGIEIAVSSGDIR